MIYLKIIWYNDFMVLTKSDSKKLTQGDYAPDFSLVGVDDKTYTIADFSKYDGLLIVFMCNHCPYVIAKMGELIDLHEKFGGRIAVVGINSSDPDYPGEGMGKMKAFVEEYKTDFTYLFDGTGSVGKSYGATCTPDPFLFDKKSRLVFHGKMTDAMEPNDKPKEHTMRENICFLLYQLPIQYQVNALLQDKLLNPLYMEVDK